MKFTVGDRVRVVKVTDVNEIKHKGKEHIESHIGAIGTVKSIDDDVKYAYPIELEFDDEEDYSLEQWKEEELEFIEPMVKIFELHQQLTDITNHQSRVVEYESFEEYLRNVNENSLPPKESVVIGKKHVNFEEETITFMFERNLARGKEGNNWIEFVHFAKVIE